MDAPLSPSPGAPNGASPDSLDVWLRRARDGSKSALGRLLEVTRGQLLKVAHGAIDDKLKSKVGASDLVQDTFADAQRDFGQFRGTTREEFNAWLLGILSNRLANNVRRFRRTARRDVDRELTGEKLDNALAGVHDVAATPGALAGAREEQQRVQVALARLPEAMRSVIVERTWQGLSFAEIGQRRNISADAARKAWARAVLRMQRLLAEN